jgi:hypothetical protein
LVQHADKAQRGFVVIPTFVSLLQELARETEKEVLLRRFAKTVGHQAINIRAELSNFDNLRIGKLEKQAFKRCLKQMSVAMSDAEIDSLYEFTQKNCQIDIKDFVAAINAASKQKPVPQSLTIQSKPGSKVPQRGASAGGSSTTNSAFENWEVEKKYKKNLEALK